MAPVLKIALIQLQSKPLAVDDNFSRAAAHIREAAASGCNLAVLPEYHLTSWVPDNPGFVAACAASAACLDRYKELARDLGINIVPGTICEVHPAGGPPDGVPLPPSRLPRDGDAGTESFEIRNMAYFLESGTGATLGSYQKKNLWHPERPHLTSSGRSDPLHAAFDVPSLPSALDHRGDGDGGGSTAPRRPLRAGLLICWDLAFPEAFRALVADGAELVVVPSWWHLTDVSGEAAALSRGLSERVFLESVPVARACEGSLAVVFCNAGGLSQVALPLVGARGRTEPVAIETGAAAGEAGGGRDLWKEKDVVSVVEVDLDLLRVAEESYLVRRDMNSEGWHYSGGR